MDQPTLTRRDVLKLSAVGATALALPVTMTLSGKQVSRLAANRLPRPYVPVSMAEFPPPVAIPTGTVPDSVNPAVQRPLYRITQHEFPLEIIRGIQTRVWGYGNNGRDFFPGPTIRVPRNQKITVQQRNEMPQTHPLFGYEFTTSTHLHGSPSRPQYDGYANDTTPPNFFKNYEYDNVEDARTLWYHDHAVHHTANNVFSGLAAQYHLLDEAQDTALGLPQGAFDIPLIISDIAFDENGQLLYDDRSTAGFMGDVILVNGRPWPEITVEPRRYRFRILDASIARGYRLTLTNGLQMAVVGTDGGLVPAPPRVSQIKIGMAERYDVVIDFTGLAGQRFEMLNAGVPNSVDFDNTGKVMRFVVGNTVSSPDDTRPVPATITPSPETQALMALQPGPGVRTRRLRFERQNGQWTINGHTWEEVVESNFLDVIANPGLNDVEVWELQNNSGGWFHPIHIHLVDFKVLDRNGRPPAPYERGPKDVVYLGEGELLRLIMRFSRQTGRYMMHCHNTTHEDHDMMFQFRVGADNNGDPASNNNPLSVPPQPIAGP